MPFIGKTPARPNAAKSPTTIDALALHQQAENAASMCAFYLRRSNLPGAQRQAVKALSAIHRLRIADFGAAANDSGSAA